MWTGDAYIISFDAEASDVAALATAAQKILWFNEAQARLIRKMPRTHDVTWAAAARSVALNTNFVQLDKIDWNDDVVPEPWRVWGETLVIDGQSGASAAQANTAVMDYTAFRFRDGAVFFQASAGVAVNFVHNDTLDHELSIVLLAANFLAGDQLRVDLYRRGTDAADTLTTFVELDGAKVSYLSS